MGNEDIDLKQTLNNRNGKGSNEFLKTVLKANNYNSVIAGNATIGISMVSSHMPDLIQTEDLQVFSAMIPVLIPLQILYIRIMHIQV